MPVPVAAITGAFGFLKEGLKRIFPDPVERAQAEAALQRAEDAGELQELDHALEQERERTTRHANDMKSDSWLSKNIRPLVLIYLLTVFSLLALFNMQVDDIYREAFVDFLKLGLMFYFVGRTGEKAIKIYKAVKDG